MRKLSENGGADVGESQTVSTGGNVIPKPKAQKAGGSRITGAASKVAKICGYILFVLGIATLFTIIYLYRFTSIIAGWAAVVAAAELTAGFSQIKLSRDAGFKKTSLIICVISLGVLVMALCFNPGLLQWPLFIGSGALAVSVISAAVFSRSKK